MKVALVHDWLTGMRGGERCLEVFCELLPDADLYTLFYIPGSASATIENRRIYTSFIQKLPLVERAYRHYLPLFPFAIQSFDLRGYDLVLSSSHCVAKGVRVPPGICHVAYVLTPMRYIWDQYEMYFGPGRSSAAVRTAMRAARPWLQRWDVKSNQSVHRFVAISNHVAQRIQRYYRREATVIHPPVDFEAFQASNRDDGFYLIVTAFAPYKRVDLAIEAFNRMRLPLKIIGTGQDRSRLERLAGPTVEFLGWRPDSEVRQAYARCRALVFTAEEDFGIVPLEAMASGKPVIAYGKGGALETVVALNSTPSEETPTGVFFQEQTVEAVMNAVEFFEAHRHRFDPVRIREHSRPFGRETFVRKMESLIQLTLASHDSCKHPQPG